MKVLLWAAIIFVVAIVALPFVYTAARLVFKAYFRTLDERKDQWKNE